MKFTVMRTIAILFGMVACYGCYSSNIKLDEQDQKQSLLAAHQYIEALRKGEVSDARKLVDKRCIVSLELGDKHPKRLLMYVDFWQQNLRLKGLKEPVDPSLFAISQKCSAEMAMSLVEGYLIHGQESLTKTLSPASISIVEFQYMKDKPAAIIPMIKSNGKWLITSMPCINTRIYRFKTLNDAYYSHSEDWIVNNPEYKPTEPSTGSKPK